MVGLNPLSPSHMTPTERLDEVGRILAAGILRARAKKMECKALSMGKERESSLDFTAKQSGHVRTKTGRGEKP